MEEAISQLQDLGVTRGQARKALARYNNDVARAADFIFSGALLSDDETEESTLSDEQLAIRLSMQEQDQQSMYDSNNNPFTDLSSTISTSPSTTTPQPPVPVYKIERVQLDKTISTTVETDYDVSKWSVVPCKPDILVDQYASAATVASTTTHQLVNESHLTWWKDPEDPSERLAIDDVPIGVRPPSYNFAYSPILIQALFHVTAFQYAVLSFRPVPYAWGSPNNYWKGFGEPVPGYIMREVVSQRPVAVQAPMNVVNDLIALDNDMTDLSIKDDLPPMIFETIQEDQERVELIDHVESELQVIPQCLQSLAEMQKLFSFLGNTSRLYGNVSHYVRALNSKLTMNGWEFSDKTFEVFLDMMIGGLVEADEQSDRAMDNTFIPIFRSLFLLKARIEYGDDYDNEEVYYLTISVDKHMDSFHDCLDPLVFESYETDLGYNQQDQDSQDASDEEDASYKFTTFKQIPPILLIVLENRTAPKKSNYSYSIDKTIYMDRYMMENKEKSLQGFKEMETCRREISRARLEIGNLKGSSADSTDKLDLLNQTLAYFENNGQDKDIESLQYIINTVKQNIESRLQDLEQTITQQREKMRLLFNSDDMKKAPYGLRATFHHDGKSGTGHYWAYIWREPAEESLLSDIPCEGGWFKFCDASVIAVSEDDIMNDPVPPFSLMYVNDAIPSYSKDQLYASMPQGLQEFLAADKELLDQEIYAYNNPQVMTNSFMSTPTEEEEEDIVGAEKINDSATLESSATFDDNTSVGTAVNGHQIQAEYNNNEIQQYSFTGEGFNKLKERVNTKIIHVASYPKDDYRFLKSFEAFLARTQNQLILEHLYLLYSSEKTNSSETEFVIDEKTSKQDEDLKVIWQEYDTYLVIGRMVTGALRCFVKKDYHHALQSLLDTKRVEASWKTQVMLDIDISHAYSGLETLSFNDTVETYGKQCLKILNAAAYAKASNPSYRSRGLEDAIRIAYQAQTVIGPDNIAQDNVYQSMGQLWLSFTEEQNVGSELTDGQVELLNTLIVTYLEGQSGGGVSGLQSRSESPMHIMSDDEEEDTFKAEAFTNVPLWQKYQQVCSESSQLLAALDK